MGYKRGHSAHSFRGTASTILHELGYRSEVIEHQLAHVDANETRATYNHAKYLPERRELMQQWADHIDALVSGGDVVPLKKAE